MTSKPTASFEDTVSWLEQGHAAIFPTDTVYGLGVSVKHAASPAILYALKGRDAAKPIAWLVGALSDLDRYGTDVPDYVYALAQRFWPGALTIVVRASAAVPSSFLGKSTSIGLRMPASSIARELIEQIACPLATTSANPSGKSAAARLEDIDARLLAKARMVLAADAPLSGQASTVLDCTGKAPRLLRQGSITLEDAVCAIRS